MWLRQPHPQRVISRDQSQPHRQGQQVVGNGLGFTFDKIDPASYAHLKKIIAYSSGDADKVLEDIHHAIDEKVSAEK
jgi:hypothetical protein